MLPANVLEPGSSPPLPPWGPGAARGNGHRHGEALATVAATRRGRGDSTLLACKAATTGPPGTTYTVGNTLNSRQRHPLHQQAAAPPALLLRVFPTV